MKNATPLEGANWFDRFVEVKEVFKVRKAELFKEYKAERILPGGFTLWLLGQKGQNCKFGF